MKRQLAICLAALFVASSAWSQTTYTDSNTHRNTDKASPNFKIETTNGVSTPHVIIDSGGTGGGLTDTQLRATPVPVNDPGLPDTLGIKTAAGSTSVAIASDGTLPLPTGASTSAAQTTAQTSFSSIVTNTGRQAAANLTTGQVTASTSAGTLVIARATRRGVLLKNTDSSITVYYGPATVTAGNGMPLKAGESTVVNSVVLIQVIAASGSPVVAYSDEYD